MFKPFKGICSCHQKERWILNKKLFCKQGNNEQKRNNNNSKGSKRGDGIIAFKKHERKNIRGGDISKSKGSVQKGFNGARKTFLVKKSPIVRRRKPTGELKIFKEIWEEREHICQVTGEPIYEFDIRLFSHILSKGAYPSCRLDKRNIWIVLPSIHERWEFKDRSHPIFDEKRKVMEQLKQEYYGQGKTKG